MATVQITIDSPEADNSKYSEVQAAGSVAAALRICLVRVAENHPNDQAVQAIAEAVYSVAKDAR